MSAEHHLDENEAVQNMLATSYVPSLITDARERQDAYLFERFKGKRFRIADVGCGDGYHGLAFGPSCDLYHGFEVAPRIAEVTRKRWTEAGLTQATVFLGSAAEADPAPESYDLVLCLYFTPGNFRESSDDLAIYTDAHLNENPGFVAVFNPFYRALASGGRMFLTVYKDVPEAEAAQRDFYEHNRQTVVTPKGSRFAATDAGFWSVRFTRESMLSNLEACDIDAARVTFHELNAIAWLVEISS